MLAPVVGGFYFGGIISGIAAVAAARGVRVVATQTLPAGLYRGENLVLPEFALDVAASHVHGYIAIACAVRRTYLERQRAAGKPIVLVSDRGEGFEAPIVLPDNAGGVRAAVEHLLRHGHRQIGFVGNLW